MQQEYLRLPHLLFGRLKIGFVPVLDFLEIFPLVVPHDELEEGAEEEYLELSGDLRGRACIHVDEDADILLEGDELVLKVVVILREVIDFVELLAGLLDEALHEHIERVLTVQLVAQLRQL